MEDKLKSLLALWPQGTVATPSWLIARGVSKQLANKYVRGGWLKSIGHGAAVRAGDQPSWSGGLAALQSQLELPVWAGGPSALSLRGYTHFVPMGRDRVWLFGAPRAKPPKWYLAHDWGVDLQFTAPALFDEPAALHLNSRPVDGLEVKVSSLERAALELLYLVPTRLEFEEASELMMGLNTLDADRMQDLLERCKLIRVVRLFLFFADYHGLPVLKRLQLDRLDLGKGSRQIVSGGRMDKVWNISVPEGFYRGT